MVFRSFVLHGSSLRVPTPQGIGTGGEVGTPAALVPQRPDDDARMVLGPLEQVPRTVQELSTPGLLRFRMRLADVAEMVGRGCTYFLLCSGQNGQWRIYVPVCRQDSARKNVDSKNTDHNMLLELSPLIFIAKAPGPVTGQQGNGQVLHKAMRLDVCFVHDIEAVFIAEFIPPWMMRVV